MAKQILQDLDFNNVSRVTNLPAASGPGQPVTYEQMNSAMEGLSWKDTVRVATQGNLNLSSPGAEIDGVALVLNDRVLVRNQTAPAENGIYIWNGAAAAMARSADASTALELEQATVMVEAGTDAGTGWRQTQVDFTLGTDGVVWASFGTSAPAASETTPGIVEIATQAEVDTGTDPSRVVTPATLAGWSGRMRKFAGAFGDGTATQFDITHNLNTRNVIVGVYRNATPWDDILCDVQRPDANTVRLIFASAPAANQFNYVIEG